MFTLLSAARNEVNEPELRKESLERLLRIAAKNENQYSRTSIYGLFAAAYRLYADCFHGSTCERSVRSISGWLNEQNEQGFPGLKDRLEPFLLSPMTLEDAERLCDALPEH